MSSTEASIQTLDRGLQVLRAFRAERLPLTNAELVRRTGLSRSSISRFTSTLVQMGYLRRVAGGSEFELAPGGFRIGMAFVRSNPVTQLVHPLMQTVADALNVSVAMGVPNGLDMLYIAYRTSGRTGTLRLDIGSLIPMGRTAMGRAWLWALPVAARAPYLSTLKQMAGVNARDFEMRISKAFKDLDATGVCVVSSEYRHNAYGIAMPIRVGRNQSLMALNLGAAELALEDPQELRVRYEPAIRRLAEQIVARLQHLDIDN